MSNTLTRSVLLAFAATLCSTLLAEQNVASPAIAALKPVPQANRVAAGADLAPQVQLTGHIPGWVTADRQAATSVDLAAPLRISVVLQRDPAVQAAFEKLLADQQTPGSPLYHQWLTPQQIGDLFGPTPSDVAAVTSWLTAQGLSVVSIAPNRTILDISGSTAKMATAFHTSFAYFLYNNQPRLSAISEPSIPAALAPVIRSIYGLTDTPIVPMSHVAKGERAPQGGPNPLLTTSNGSHYVTPNDFDTIYDINSVHNGGNTGAKIGAKTQHVAIIGRSRVATTDISEFEANTGLPSVQPNVIIPTNGVDPGPVCTTANYATCTTAGDQDEATLDVDRVIGTAYGATVDLVVATNASGGISLAASYNVNTLLDPVMTLSFGACETSGGVSGVDYWDALFSTAAGEGISVFVASGDSGAAGCEPYNATPTIFPEVAGINYICASSYATCAGGTEFNDTASPSTYWSATNGTGYESALSYIPEGAWNEPTALNSNNQTIYVASSTGGGASKYITKPSWQTGTGVPADGARDTPDISLSSASHDGYYACLDYALGNASENCTNAGGGWFFYFAGTSAAAPGMAGITALLNTAAGTSQGNLNPTLYRLAASAPTAFHDATVATSGVTGCTTATPSICNNSTPSATGLTGGLAGFALTTGYDEATGLGSLDVANFLVVAAPAATTIAVTASANPTTTGTGVTFTGKLTYTSTFTPTGSVQFYSNGTALGSAVAIASGSATTPTQTFSTAGTYSITATYTGDTNFLTSTSPTYSEVVNASPTFSVTPTSLALSLPAGATTGNTDSIALASVNTFAGSVALTCAVTNLTGTAAGTCSVAPTPVALTSGGTGTSLLTINTTTGTSGTLKVIVTGASGTTVVPSAAITVTVIGPTFTVTPQTTNISLVAGATTGNTDSITLASVNSFAGSVALTCTVTNAAGTAAGSCALNASPLTLTSGGTAASVLTISTTPGTGGSLSVTVTGTSGLTVATSSIITVLVTAPSFSLSAGTIAPFSSGATTGNTGTVTLTSINQFAGTVAMSCSMSGTGYYPATCAVSSPTSGSVPLAAGGTAAVTITITSVTPHDLPSQGGHASLGWRTGGGAVLAMLVCLLPFRRRRIVRSFTLCGLLVLGLTAISGCGGSSTPTTPTLHGSAGSYTVTVTGTGFTTGAVAPNSYTGTTTFSLTIN